MVSLNIDIPSNFLYTAQSLESRWMHLFVFRTEGVIAVDSLIAFERLIQNGNGALYNGAVFERVHITGMDGIVIDLARLRTRPVARNTFTIDSLQKQPFSQIEVRTFKFKLKISIIFRFIIYFYITKIYISQNVILFTSDEVSL